MSKDLTMVQRAVLGTELQCLLYKKDSLKFEPPIPEIRNGFATAVLETSTMDAIFSKRFDELAESTKTQWLVFPVFNWSIMGIELVVRFYAH